MRPTLRTVHGVMRPLGQRRLIAVKVHPYDLKKEVKPDLRATH